MKIFKKAILPVGFEANGVWCGIKKSGKADLALLYSQIPAKACAQFTTNSVKAAPIIVTKSHLASARYTRAIVVNSGNANSFTGRGGIADASATAKALARLLAVPTDSVLVASTGIIGKPLAMGKIIAALPQLVAGLSSEGIAYAKRAILTTDTCAKEITVKLNIGNCPVTLCGIAKGAGMIAPNMATMLSFILTDAALSQQALKKALAMSVDTSFNCITVDGCMSTNDSVMILANGAARNNPIQSGSNFHAFASALQVVCLELAKMIVMDAEGATKFILIHVQEARNFKEAKAVGLAIANSNLFKTAMYGQDPNFGRVVSSVGASGVKVREQDLKIRLSPLHKKMIKVEVSLGQGKAECKVYTSDLTPEYIKINAAYS